MKLNYIFDKPMVLFIIRLNKVNLSKPFIPSVYILLIINNVSRMNGWEGEKDSDVYFFKF